MAEIKIEESLKPNSHRYRDEKQLENRKPLDPVVSKDHVNSLKPGFLGKIKNVFVKEDIQDIKDYVIFDVIIPGIKDSFMSFMEMMFYGKTRSSNSSIYQPGRTSYREKYRPSSTRLETNVDDGYRRNDKVDYRRITVTSRIDAEEVVNALKMRIRTYGAASVADLLELTGYSSDFNHNSWGWTVESDIGYRRYGGRYLIDVREATYLD